MRPAQAPSGGGTLAIYTDSLDFAAKVLPEALHRNLSPGGPPKGTALHPLHPFLPADGPLYRGASAPAGWSHLLLASRASRSNYDQLIEMARSDTPPPHRTACLAGEGLGFHGFKGRSWAAVAGNLHLSVFLAPGRPIERFEVAFTVLAALSVTEALDAVPGMEGRAGIKWVNDIVVTGAKLAGVLAYTQTQEQRVNAAVLGMGVNVETAPQVEPTPFVPAVTSLRKVVPGAPTHSLAMVHLGLLEALERNYRLLMEEGYPPLLDRYRARSVILGREVSVCSEAADALPEVVAHGKVRAIGEGLEIFMEGQETPVTRGRMILGNEAGAPPADIRGRGSIPLWRTK